MAVVLDAAGTTITISANPTDNTSLTVGTGNNRALCVVLGGPFPSAPTISMTWDQGGTNQSMTQVGVLNQTGGTSGQYLAIFGLLAPTSGNKTLRIAGATGGATTARAIAVSWSEVEQSSISAAFINPSSATGSSATASVTITTNTNDVVMAVFGATSSSAFSSTNQTQLFVSGRQAANRNTGADNLTVDTPVDPPIEVDVGIPIEVQAGTASTATMQGALSPSGAWTALGIDIVAASTPAGSTPVVVSSGRLLGQIWA